MLLSSSKMLSLVNAEKNNILIDQTEIYFLLICETEFSLPLFSVSASHLLEPLIAVLFPSLAFIPDTFLHSIQKK